MDPRLPLVHVGLATTLHRHETPAATVARFGARYKRLAVTSLEISRVERDVQCRDSTCSHACIDACVKSVRPPSSMEESAAAEPRRTTTNTSTDSTTTATATVATADRPAPESGGGEDAGPEGEGCDVEVWEMLSASFRQVQSALDRNRALISQVNENHHSKVPDNLAKNVGLIREINGNISKVLSIYSDLSVNFSGVVYQRRALQRVPAEGTAESWRARGPDRIHRLSDDGLSVISITLSLCFLSFDRISILSWSTKLTLARF